MSTEFLKLNSPLGDLTWVNITGEGKDNYNKDGKIYASTVELDKNDPALKDFEAKIKKLYDDNHKPGYKLRNDKLPTGRELFKPEMDENGQPLKNEEGMVIYSDESTGKVAITASTNTTYADGKPNVVKVYNAKGKAVDLGEKRIGNGSVGLIKIRAKYYKSGREDGVALYLDGVQLAKFVEFEGEDKVEAIDGDFDGFDGLGNDTSTTEVAETEEAPTETPKVRL